jgi:hypothetical protein
MKKIYYLLPLLTAWVLAEVLWPTKEYVGPCGPEKLNTLFFVASFRDSLFQPSSEKNAHEYFRKSICITGHERLFVERGLILKRVTNITYIYHSKVQDLKISLENLGFDYGGIQKSLLEKAEATTFNRDSSLVFSYKEGTGTDPVVSFNAGD